MAANPFSTADELVYDYLGNYHFGNPFFREWVKRM